MGWRHGWVLLACLCGPVSAWAQGVGTNVFDSVEKSSTSAAAGSNARLYGAVGFLESTLLPAMAASPGGVVIGAETNNIQGLARAPVEFGIACDTALGHAPGTCPYGRLDIDTFSSSGGWGYQSGHFGLFYTAGWTGTRFTEPGVEFAYPFWVGSLMALGFFNTYAAPFQTGPLKIGPGFNDLIAGSQSAYIVGGTAEFFGVSGRVGFLGSSEGNGAFVSVADHDLHLGGSAVLQDNLGELPYTRFGLDKSPLLGKLLFEPKPDPLLTSLYVRRLTIPGVSVEKGEVAKADALWSVHAELLNLPTPVGVLVDALTSVQVNPAARFEYAGGTIHTPMYHASGSGKADDFFAGAGLTLAYVRLPTMRYYGLEGGGALSWTLDLRSSFFTFSIGKNDLDMLARFPQAQRAYQVHIGFALPGWDMFGDDSDDSDDDSDSESSDSDDSSATSSSDSSSEAPSVEAEP
jgi:hypothetical protein